MADVLRDWTRDETISPSKTYRCDYVLPSGIKGQDSTSHASVSTTETTYETAEYTDEEGRKQTEDVVTVRRTNTTTCVGAANLTRWRSKLENGSPAMPGTTLVRTSTTTYTYAATKTGMRTVQEVVEEYEPLIAFGGSIGIQNWFKVDLGTSSVLVSRTITTHEWDEKADRTKVIVSRWLAWGLTQEGASGAAGIAKALDSLPDADRVAGITTLVDGMLELVFDGSETRLSIGRGAVQSRPNRQEYVREELNKEPAQTIEVKVERKKYNWPMRSDPSKKLAIKLSAKAATDEPLDPTDPNDPFADLPLISGKKTYKLPFPTDDYVSLAMANTPGLSDGVGDGVEEDS